MADFVLVHGGSMSTDTWNRLRNRNDYPPKGYLGARYWGGTVAFLEAHGHRVLAPALGDEFTHTLSDHIGQVCDCIMTDDLRGIVLVGHSYGGFVITGVADRLPKRIRKLVYLDTAIPDPGESLIGILRKIYSGPHSANLPDPTPPYAESIRYNPATLQCIPRTYIRCTKGEFSAVTLLAKEKITSAPEGWTYLELPTSHVPMATMPVRFHRMLLRIGTS